MAKKDPFPNDWDEVVNAKDDDFYAALWAEVMEDVSNWHLPQPYVCVVRSFDRKTNKLKEYAYRLPSKANNRIKQLALADEEITVMTDEVIAAFNYDPS